MIFKLAALETLGYICEELVPGILSDHEINSILSAIVNEISAEDEVKIGAMNTFKLIIPLCEKNMRISNERALILERIAVNCNDEKKDIRTRGIKCLLEFAKNFYDYIKEDGLDMIGRITIKEIEKSNNEDIGILAIEIWCTI